MANRHLLRSVSLQILFELDFSQKSEKVVDDVILRNIKEFAPETGDFSFVENLVNNVLKKQKEIDNIIEKAAPEWPINKISMVDRNILRIGLYELLFADRSEVPAKVAINEAIELAKSFGGENSGKFINGVLGAVYKEIGEPGKDQKSNKIKKDVPYDKMPRECLAGGVVFAREGEEVYIALVHDVFGHWTLSKGHLKENENEKEGIKRIIKDEIGIDVSTHEKLGENEYVASQPEKGKLRKHVTYYLVESKFVDLKLKDTGGLDDAKWFKLADILDLNFYDDMLPVVTKAVNILVKSDVNAK